MAPAEATVMRSSIVTYRERGSPGSPSRSSGRRRQYSRPGSGTAPRHPHAGLPRCAGPRCLASSPCGASPTMLARPAPPPTRASPPPRSAIPQVSSTRAVSTGHQINISHFQQTYTRQEYALRAFVSACDTMQVPTLEDKFLTAVWSHP